MIFWDDFKHAIDVSLHPGKGTKKPLDMGGVFAAYYKAAAIPLFVFVLLGALDTFIFIGAPYAGTASVLFAVVALVVVLILGPIALFVSALVLHLFGKAIFRAFGGDLEDTLAAIYYSVLPRFALLWLLPIPGLGAIAAVLSVPWSVLVLIIALANLHRTSRLAAFGVMVAASIGIALVCIAIVATVLSAVAPLWFHSFGQPFAMGVGQAPTGGQANAAMCGIFAPWAMGSCP